MYDSKLAIAAVSGALLGLGAMSCASNPPPVEAPGVSPTAARTTATTLTVALYPWVPRPDQFKAVIERQWRLVQPMVELKWAADGWDGGYSTDPDPSYDVFVFDAMNLGYFQSKGYLRALTAAEVESYADIVPFAAQGVTSDGRVLGIPQLGCGDFLFYRSNDDALASATTASALRAAMGTCTYYPAAPPNASTGLLLDLAGGTTDASTYVESLHEATGQFPVKLPRTPAEMDAEAAATVQEVVSLSSFATALYSDDRAPYQRATWFNQGVGRAYVGFTESMSQLSDATLATVSFKPMPWSENPAGAKAPLLYSDVAGVGASTAKRGTESLAIQLANLMTSSTVIVEIFGASGTSGPQYLMPVRSSALRALAGRYPIYQKMATMLQGLKPTLLNLGPTSKPWLESMKKNMQRMVLAQPACYTDFPAPSIANKEAAQKVCPTVCASHNGWNSQWTSSGDTSSCGCNVPSPRAATR